MNKISYHYLQESLAGLKQKGILDASHLVMYFVQPQITDFGYAFYDFNVVNVDFNSGDTYITVSGDIDMLVSFQDIDFSTQAHSSEKLKIYVHFDPETLVYNLYFKVLNNWEKVERVDFKVASEPQELEKKQRGENEKFIRLARYITKANIINGMNKFGEKYFTEAVLDKYLENQEFNNEFIRTALRNEFKKPSKELIAMLASALGKEFTTMEQEKVQEKLEPLVEKGLYEAVEHLINDEPGGNFLGGMGSFSQRPDYGYLNEKKEETPELSKPEITQKETKIENKEVVVEKPTKPTVNEEKVDKKESQPRKSGLDALKDLGIDMNKKPVSNPQVTLSDNGAVDLTDLF